MNANDLLKSHHIDANALEPIRKGSRFQLTPKIIGRLEHLAKVRFDISPLVRSDIDQWRQLSDEAYQALAQSVNASSQIENEHIRAEELDLVLAAVTQQEDNVVTAELSERARAVKSIVETYLWALTLDKKSFIDFDFVLEIHARMFVTIRPLIAGRLKSKKDWFGESEDLTPWVEYYINSIYTQYLRAFQRVLDRQHNRF